jgi:hypothetical protein
MRARALLAAAALLAWCGAARRAGAQPRNPNKPVIEGLTPKDARAGGGDFILRVRGANFSGQSVVRWNGADRVTAEIAPDLLTAMILASDVSRVGQARVSVFDPVAGLSDPAPIEVRPGGGTAAARRAPNPVPSVLAFQPEAAQAGARSLRLTVRGYGYTPLSVVRFRGAPRRTSFVSSTTLTAELLAEDLRSPGNAAISVRNPLPGGGVSRPKLLPVEANAELALDKPRVYPNPWRSDVNEGQRIAFENLAIRSMIKIFTPTGTEVKTIPAGDGAGEWDLTDRAGLPVRGGAYVYLITDGKKTVEGKLKISR